VRTKSGATAVQIVESVAGRRRIVRHVGSAHDEATLALLVNEARDLLRGDIQGELDLGLVTPQRHVRLVPPPKPAALFADQPAAALVAPPTVIRTGSRLLYETLSAIFDDLGFDLGDDVFRDLVIARIVEPTSLMDVDRVLADLGRKSASLSSRKRTLKKCTNNAYRDKIAQACFTHARNQGDVSLVLYDVTTLYFEAENEDVLRKVGYSKERRIDPQIIVGLLVDRTGFPLEIGCFEGNKAETQTIVPIIKQFQQRHGIKHMVVAADAGMLSAANLKALDEAGFYFIVGSRATKGPIDLASHFRWHGDYFTDGQIIDTITPKYGRTSENNPMAKVEPVWDEETHPGSWRAVWAYSHKRYLRDARNLQSQEDRARSVIGGEKTARTPRFVKIKGGAKTLDEAGLKRARKMGGLKGYVTNIPVTRMPAKEVISSYHDLWHVEQSFRMSKIDLRARPFFARTRDAIEAHLTIVFTALAVSREIQTRTGLSIRKVLQELRPLRSATITINGALHDFPPEINPDAAQLLTLLKTPDPRH